MNIPFRKYWDLLKTYLKPQWPKALLLAALILGNIGLRLVNPQILRDFIDAALAGDTLDTLWRLALLFIGAALASQVVSVVATYVGEDVGWTATNALRADLALHVLRLDLSFHKSRTPGELIERIDGDVTAMATFFSQFAIQVLGNALLLIGVLALLFREDWRAGLGLTLFALGALFVLLRIRSIAVPHWARVREASANFFGFLGEHLSGTEDIRSSGATSYVMRRFYAHLRRWLPLQRRASIAGYSMWLTTLAVFGAGNAIAFGLGAWLFSAGAITLGTVYLIFNYTELLRQPIEQIRTQLQELQQASAGIGRVEALFKTRSKIEAIGDRRLPSGALAIEFDNVSFGYEDRANPLRDASEAGLSPDWVLHDISFQLKPGTTLGLLGRTGSGKTTLARLLLRLYDVNAGEICLGGVSIQEASLREVRRRAGLVTQDVQLFQATIRDNLTFFNRAIPDEHITAVLHELGLWEWLRSLPDGLDTELESEGGGLSAGEAQLLAFARVFLRDPGLVILDEASSRLDPATERLIDRAVSRLLAGRTGIIIAHRLGTVQRVDEIMILDSGQIAEHGPRGQLARDPSSHFARLLRTGLEEVLA